MAATSHYVNTIDSGVARNDASHGVGYLTRKTNILQKSYDMIHIKRFSDTWYFAILNSIYHHILRSICTLNPNIIDISDCPTLKCEWLDIHIHFALHQADGNTC